MKSAVLHYFENPHIVHTCSATFGYILSRVTVKILSLSCCAVVSKNEIELKIKHTCTVELNFHILAVYLAGNKLHASICSLCGYV